jgi:hypothetical protein
VPIPAGTTRPGRALSPMRFPQLEGRDLEGLAVSLPEGLPGHPRVAVLAFRRGQQRDVDSWLPWLARRGVAFFEIPTIGRSWAPGRRFIDGGMKAAIPDPATRRRTITVYTDVGAVLRALDLPGTDAVALLALDSLGEVAGRVLGPFDEPRAAELGAVLDAL